jgi:hypothetical protein
VAGSAAVGGEDDAMSGELRWPSRVASGGMALIAVAAVSAALVAPRVSRANWVWEWQDVAAARLATVLAGVSALVAVGSAALARKQRPRPRRSLLGAEAVFTAVAVASAVLLVRSGTWLPNFRPVIP